MKLTGIDLSFIPSDAALAELNAAWSWRLPQPIQPVIVSTLGDVFFQQETEAVFWLNTGTADVIEVAASQAHFLDLLKTDEADKWFRPDLIRQLKAAGKRLQPDHCYTYITLPIFAEGKYEVSNLYPMPAREHFGLTGRLHCQLQEVTEGQKVKIVVDQK